MKIIPAIDIIDGKCVRLKKGDYSQKKIYSNNPLEIAKSFEELGISHLHVVDLGQLHEDVIYRVLQKILRFLTGCYYIFFFDYNRLFLA